MGEREREGDGKRERARERGREGGRKGGREGGERDIYRWPTETDVDGLQGQISMA